ncbi:MAG: seg [Candidatus Paceibacter sp.]|nr:seg [Candidatus Paceibacter sp.]
MLVEILVSLTIFTVVVVMSTAAILAVVDANTKAQSTKAVMDNVSVAVENMSRSIRIGTEYTCITGPDDPNPQNGTACQAGSAGIKFLPQDAQDAGDYIEYYRKTVNIGGTPITSIYRNRFGQEVALTAPEVNITGMDVFVIGSSANDGQPRVFLIIIGESGITSGKSKFHIQTTISQRQPDNS